MRILKEDALKNFRAIPGVGAKLAKKIYALGHRSYEDLAKADPEVMYARRERQVGCHVDRCVLYVFRCAVYYSKLRVEDGQIDKDDDLLKWWYWTDKRIKKRERD